MSPTVIRSCMASLRRLRDRTRGMSEPDHRVAAGGAIAFPDVRPVGVLFEVEKNAQSALIGALRQHDFVTFPECRISRFDAHLGVPPSLSVLWKSLDHGRNPGLFTSRALSCLVFATPASVARRAASR